MILSRIKQNVLIDPRGCWLWLGCLDHKGYGRIKVNGRSARVHIVTFTILVGPPPPSTVLDHTCRTRHCCNPGCLEPVTAVENNRRGESPSAQRRRQTHCKYGHELVGDNVYERPDRPGMRECRTCKRQQRVKVATPPAVATFREEEDVFVVH